MKQTRSNKITLSLESDYTGEMGMKAVNCLSCKGLDRSGYMLQPQLTNAEYGNGMRQMQSMAMGWLLRVLARTDI